jgi:tetratricopeptide (TPR) repeat protein
LRYAWVLLLPTLLACGCGENAPPPPAETRDGVTQVERDRVRRFWKSFNEGDALRRDGRWEEGVVLLGEALEADPDHEGALYGRANCLLELGRHAEALPHLERLVELNPLSQRAHVQLAYLRSAPDATCCFDLEVARRELVRAVEINREETGALMRLAEVELALGRFDDARKRLDQVRRANSHSVGAPWLLAWLAHRDGRRDDASALLAEAWKRARGPELPTAVPAEGDTRGDHRLVASTLPSKRLLPPEWVGLEDRHGDEPWTSEAAAAELSRLAAALARIAATLAAP